MRYVVFAALALSIAASADGPDLKAASDAFRAGQYAKVLEHAAKVADGHADRAKALYLSGEAQLMLAKPADAQASFEAALALKPDAPALAVGVGRALLAQGQAAPAVERLTKAVAKHPKDADVNRVLGEALVATGDRAGGIARLETAVALDKTDPIAARALVQAQCDADQPDRAAAVANAFGAANPKHAMGPFLVGVVHDRTGKYDAAITAYEQAATLDVKFLDAHKNLAILCHTRSNTYQDVAKNKLAFKHYALYFENGGSDAKLREMFETLKAAAKEYNIPH